ncbi:MAG: orotate phosphoribosyltransferase [Deltaproteobacteria bacterium]|jgi:orotate phosphoribosyltransferase|nr:orotate phosphoribosyltransferase [Deltaproteobacteria bacterium]
MDDTLNLKKRLAKILLEKSYLEGDFTLSSGLKSDYYFDCRQTSLHPEGAWLMGRIFTGLLAPLGVNGLGGMTLGADPIISAVMLAGREAGFNWPGLIVRKEAKKHGTGRNLEGLANFKAGCVVGMLEDVVSTGGSVLKACESVRAAGFKVRDVLCVLDREMGGREALAELGCELRAIFTRAELVKLAAAG